MVRYVFNTIVGALCIYGAAALLLTQPSMLFCVVGAFAGIVYRLYVALQLRVSPKMHWSKDGLWIGFQVVPTMGE